MEILHENTHNKLKLKKYKKKNKNKNQKKKKTTLPSIVLMSTIMIGTGKGGSSFNILSEDRSMLFFPTPSEKKKKT